MRAFAFPPKISIHTKLRQEILLIFVRLFFKHLGQIQVGLTETSSSKERLQSLKTAKKSKVREHFVSKKGFIFPEIKTTHRPQFSIVCVIIELWGHSNG